jgi:lysine 6-dehydrogenase
MSYNYLIVGSGSMGEAIAYDLLQDKETFRVELVDKSSENLLGAFKRIKDKRLHTIVADANNYQEMHELMRHMDVAIGAASYEFNEILTRAAISTGSHFCDLGGNNTVVSRQFALNHQAKSVGVKIIPDCGIAPGAVSTIVQYGIAKMIELGKGMPESVHIRVGGLPQHPKGPLGYKKVFSVHGLLNEYIEPTEILHNGELTIVESLEGIEKIIFKDARFKNGMLELEAAYTSGGSSTLGKTYEGIITSLDYKTLRYKGHWELMKAFKDSGFFSEIEKTIGKTRTTPRAITENLIDGMISYESPDILLVRVTLQKGNYHAEYDLVDFQNEQTGHTAMQRTTGYSAAIVAQMMAKDLIVENGVLTIEQHIPPAEFVDEWKKRGILLKEKIIHS